VTPMYLGRTLHEHLMKKNFTEAEARKIFREILFILAFCHCIGISVTAISLHSFAFVGSTMLAEIAEFDFRRSLHHISPLKLKIREILTAPTGFALYAAPENISKSRFIGRDSDMWSAG